MQAGSCLLILPSNLISLPSAKSTFGHFRGFYHGSVYTVLFAVRMSDIDLAEALAQLYETRTDTLAEVASC